MIRRPRRFDLIQLIALVAVVVLFVWGINIGANEPPPRDVGRWQGLVHDGDNSGSSHRFIELGLSTWHVEDNRMTITSAGGANSTTFDIGGSVRRWNKDWRSDHSLRVLLQFNDGRTVRWSVKDGVAFQSALHGVPQHLLQDIQPVPGSLRGDSRNYWWVAGDRMFMLQGDNTISFETESITDVVYRTETGGLTVFTAKSFFGPFFTDDPAAFLQAASDAGLDQASPVNGENGWRVELYRARD